MVKIREMKHQTEVIRWLKEKINGKNESAQGQRKYDRQGLISKNLDFKQVNLAAAQLKKLVDLPILVSSGIPFRLQDLLTSSKQDCCVAQALLEYLATEDRVWLSQKQGLTQQFYIEANQAFCSDI